jgi:ubiquinol-cytochrome c reductase iron-sulfur subunit
MEPTMNASARPNGKFCMQMGFRVLQGTARRAGQVRSFVYNAPPPASPERGSVNNIRKLARGARRGGANDIQRESSSMAEDGAGSGGDTDLGRRKFLTTATIATGGLGAVLMLMPFIASWRPSERARAEGAPTELDVSKLEPGQMAVVTWRRQQIFVVRRTPEMVESIQKLGAGVLKDPESADSEQPAYAANEIRARRPEFLVVIGNCTHLGCLPKARFEPDQPELGANWPGGFFCPCHGSKFDLAGRVFEGSPASVNLKIPPYSFAGDSRLVIGVDEPAQALA